MFKEARLIFASNIRRFTTAVRHLIEDEGDWFYSFEWWDRNSDGHTVFRSTSDKGNGIITVLAHPSSRPSRIHWPNKEKWLDQRYAEVHTDHDPNDHFRILGYQWRTLRFNEETRQSTVKVMAACRESDPGSVYFMQQGHCLAVPYVKSMVSAGLAALVSCNYDLKNAVCGNKTMNILCVGHGGGGLPLFLASKIQGAIVHIVEIDPLVISASTRAMGFPSFSIVTPNGDRAYPKPGPIDEALWSGIHERLHLYESDAENFISDRMDVYDLVFVDAYDGDDIFPRKLWDPHSPFLKSLRTRLSPENGTVVVNLHADEDILNTDRPVPDGFRRILPMGKYVSSVSKAYKDVLLGDGNGSGNGVGFRVYVPWVCNSSLVVCRGFGRSDGGGVLLDNTDSDRVLDTLLSSSIEVENLLGLPFSCFGYVRKGFGLVD